MLIQISMIYAGFLGLLLVVLSFNVMQNWVRVTGKGQETDRDMRRAERILASFVEYIPFTLILLVLVEIKGTPHIVLHALGSAIVVARLMHAYGSNEFPGAGLMRFLGAQLTFITLTILSMGCIYFYGLNHM